MDESSEKSLRKILKIHAKALDIPEGSAEIFIDKSIASAKKSLSKHKFITDQDIVRAVAKELKKYHADLAYVYANYDKII